MGIYVKRSGALTTIQDLGREGYQQYGVIQGGAMDPSSARLSNIIVGNDENEGVLELCLLGPKLVFEKDCFIALTGAKAEIKINDIKAPQGRLIYIEKGATLDIGAFQSGVYGYLAIRGGFEIKKVLGSKSTYLRAEAGGFLGRALKVDDYLNIQATQTDKAGFNSLKEMIQAKGFAYSKWSVARSFFYYPQNIEIIRVTKGSQFDWFDEDAKKRFFSNKYQVSSKSDRMGYRLEGEMIKKRDANKELISEPIALGSIQIPNDGQPIVLLADRQTVGGYPKIASVIFADIGKFVQLKPHSFVQFVLINIEDAEKSYIQEISNFKLLKQSLKFI
ncbi:biotin-dependent carboxyltransferase family protein [Fangia hongkongensis]|uniref:5-oxoprolinase subunit C family protein n=1 Tax=Fangia hongkongensis TaxID=270495 RepID=UPI0003820279|nr:biotin-dependent carboxyltransferase family protein [Fangia hongkongensis]MBK2126219.1 biotin-dependent carboxyltransferase family protein [Fangia hongkongensis]